jgi:hypothetical protein
MQRVTSEHDKAEANRRWVIKMRRRAAHNVMRVVVLKTSAMAARAARQRRSRRQSQPQPQLEALNPVAEFRREVMPLIAQLAEAAGGDPAPFLELAKPKRRPSRKR